MQKLKSFIEHICTDSNLKESLLEGYDIIFESSDSKILAYHGTNSLFNRFNPDRTQDSLFWFSTNKDKIITGNSGATGSKYIMTCLLNIKNPAGWNEYEMLNVDQLIVLGYDSVKLDDDYIVFNPDNIQIIKRELAKSTIH